MKCSTIQRKLSAYLDEEVSEQEKKAVLEHLATCPACRHAVQELSQVNDTLIHLEGMDVSPYFYTRLKQRLYDREKSVGIIEKFQRIAVPALASASIIGSLVLGNFMAKTIYQGIAEKESATETANIFGIDSFDEFPSGSVSYLYHDLVTGGE